MELEQIIRKVEQHQVDISVWLEDFPPQLRKYVMANNYYWGLAAYIDLYKAQQVLELGTCTGASAVVMARAGATVDTYDVVDVWELNFWPENINRHLADDPRYIQCIDFFFYDMIFVDIDHMGKEETKIHQLLLKSGYEGIVFYDDIWLNEAMRAFWDQIEQEKQACFWHGPSGFGAVRY